MNNNNAVYKNAWPYQEDKMNLPVADVDAALPFYENVMGFTVVTKQDEPFNKATLQRDSIEIAIVENGGDPSNDGCFFEVENVNGALEELKSKGLEKPSAISTQKHGDVTWNVFFVVAPDGLCYCIGEKH